MENQESLPPKPEKGQLTYNSYLKINDLLSLQELQSNPKEHDELLFILIHQIYELWFKELLHDIEAGVALLKSGQILPVHKIMKRVLAIQQVMIQQIDVLETMTPQDFNTFRDLLNPASGFQSSQFREVEYACGLKDERYMRFHEHDPVNLEKLQKRMEAPTLYEVIISLLKSKGYDVDEGTPEEGSESSMKLQMAFKKIYQEHESHYDLYLLCESLIQFDELFQIWRFRHVKMVERTIGTKRGTGGSSGAAYLRSTVDKSFFPELWEVRSEL